MQVALSYGAPSGVNVAGGQARVRLAGARERPRLRYRATVKRPLALRELMGALHDVVIADFRWRPPDTRDEFRRWLRYKLDQEAAAEHARLEAERRRFFEYLWAHDKALWYVLDPVCSVHPDQVFFEAFSRDGSSYARVGLDRSGLKESGEVVCGTTNVDFSAGLYEAFRRLRSIWTTELTLGEEALEVSTEGATHTEKKVDLPEAWVRGFVNIGAAFLLDATPVELHPVHVHDICRYLRLNRARVSPRALRWDLVPGQPAEAVFEPWEHRMRFEGSTHGATKHRIVRVWGRRRLALLERVIPVADSFVFHLLGRGLPYFVTARAGGLDFTLGLSGWTKTDWTSTARFSALVARKGGKGKISPKPLAWLEKKFRGHPGEMAVELAMEVADVHASLVDAAARGQVVYDLLHKVYRHRPLLAVPLPPEVSLGQDPQEQEGRALVVRDAAVVTGTRRELDGGTRVTGRVTEDPEHIYQPMLTIGEEGSVKTAECGCFFSKQHGLKKGLCAHLHALLLVYE